MYVLGVESATSVAGVALIHNNGILAERLVNNKKVHSIHLMTMIKAVVEDAGVKPRDISGVAVSSGPGSFTGLRIGMTVAKTLAQVWGIPVVGISTLDALSYSLGGHVNLVCPLLNARKNEVYTSVYDGSDGVLKNLSPHKAMKPESLVDLLASWPNRSVTFLGDGVVEYRDKLSALMGKRAAFASGANNLPRGASVAELGLFKLEKGEGTDPVFLLPEYVRLSEAEMLWQQKQQAINSECSVS